MSLPVDPLMSRSIADFAAALRSGQLTSEEAVRAYLERIAILDPHLGAFEQVDASGALKTARCMDRLLSCGVDLGPLMGLPVSIKDLFFLDGLPIHAGSNMDISGLAGEAEGSFITALRRTGCVILGTTKMVEFALGITGHSKPRGTPWNPWDSSRHRLPGGSSSGAGVSLAAGLCGLSIGTDTGGSVRVPAAMCGLFGLKTTFGLWPTDGVFPLDPTADSIGLLTHSAEDASVAYKAISEALDSTRVVALRATDLRRIKFGLPERYFLEDLSPQMTTAFKTALDSLQSQGALVESVTVPHAEGRETYFPVSMPAHLLALLGEERFDQARDVIDPIIMSRITKGRSVSAHHYLQLVKKRQHDCRESSQIFKVVDAFVSPTTQSTAALAEELSNPDAALQAALGMTRNTQPVNYLNLCAASIPLPTKPGELPMGFQVVCAGGNDEQLLSLSLAVQAALGKPPRLAIFREHAL